MQPQAHGFGVHGHTGLETDVGGKIAAMQMIGHGFTLYVGLFSDFTRRVMRPQTD